MAILTVPTFSMIDYDRLRAPTVRVYYSKTFTAEDGTVIGGGTPSSGDFFKEVECELSGSQITVPEFTIYTTDDGIDCQNSKVSFYLYDGEGQLSPNPLMPYVDLVIPETLTTASLAELENWNDSSPSLPPDGYYNRREIDRMIVGLVPVTYYEFLGNVEDPEAYWELGDFAAGLYRLSVFIVVRTPPTSGTLSIVFNFTDPTGWNVVTTAISNMALGAHDHADGSVVVAKQAGNFIYGLPSWTALVGPIVYDAYFALEKLG